MRGFTVPHACPAEIDALATAVTPEGRWFVLSAGGTTARCWPADLDGPLGAPMLSMMAVSPGEFSASGTARLKSGRSTAPDRAYLHPIA